MIDLGIVKPGSTLRIPFSSFDKDDGSSITLTNYAVADILIYKDGSTTERASTSGFTATTDFDAKTGKHLAIIDLADNTTADFFQAGSEYIVAIDAVTIDGVTTGGWIARFRIGYRAAILDTFIATLASQTSFTLNSGPAEDDALNGLWILLHDAASAVQMAWALVLDYTGSTKTVTLAAAPTFTIAAKDNFCAMFPAPLQPTVLGRTLDVSAGGEGGVDWANVGGPTTAQNLSGTNIKTDQVVASVSGAVGSVTAGVTLAASAVQAIWDAATSALTVAGSIGKKLADWVVGTIDTYTGNTKQTGDAFVRLGAPAGASVSADIAGVQSDTDDIQTRLPAALSLGRMDSRVLSMGSNVITEDAIASNAITSAELDASAITEIQSGLALSSQVDALEGDTTAIRTAVESASFGLSALKTLIDAIKAKTDNLPGDPGDASDIAALLAALQSDLDNIQTRLPAALELGLMRSHVVTLATDSIGPNTLAANTIGASDLAADAVTEIQAGMATAASLTLQATEIQDIQDELAALESALGEAALEITAIKEAAEGAGININLDQEIPVKDITAEVAATVPVSSALLGARAQAAGSWVKSGTTLTLKNPDGSTFRVFTLDSASAPNSRT